MEVATIVNITSSCCNLKLYKKTIWRDSTEKDCEMYKTHGNVLNRVKTKAKMSYYIDKCNQYKNNTRKLWQVINQTLGKQRHHGSIIPYINVEVVRTYNPK